MENPTSENRSQLFGAKALRRTIILILVLVGCVAIALISRPPPQAIVFHPIGIREQGSSLARLVNGWSWKITGFIFHGHRTVDIKATFLRAPNVSRLRISNELKAGNAFSESNGVKVWLLANPELLRLQAQLSGETGNEILARPRVITASGCEAIMSVSSAVTIQKTNRTFGLEMSALPYVSKSSTDLWLTLLSTEAVTNEPSHLEIKEPSAVSIKTNIAVAARLRIPTGMGVLLVNDAFASGPENPTNSGGIVVAITLETEQSKR